MAPAPTMPIVLPASGTPSSSGFSHGLRTRALGQALGGGQQQREDVLGDGHGVGAGGRRPDARAVHEAVLEPGLDAGRVELHPLHRVAQERARERHLLGLQMV